MNWTLDQLQAFVTASRLGSFSAAARHLGKAQSRVSSAISNLEADLGFDLFDRSARLPVLTSLGEEMLAEASAILAQCERMESRALTASKSEQLSVVMATDEAVPVISFYALLVELEQRFPEIRLTMIHGSRDDNLKSVEEGRADFGITFRHRELPDILDFQSVGHFKYQLVVAPEHPLVEKSAPTLTDLQAYRQLVICDRTGEGRDKPLTANHWHIDSYFLISDLVSRQVGWAFIPSHVAHSEWYREELVSLPTDNIPQALVSEIGIIKRRDRAESTVANWLADEMRQLFNRNSDFVL